MLVIANVIFALALLMASVAGNISPTLYWPMAFFGFSLPLLFIINLLFLALWLISWKKEVVIPILALLFSIWHLPKFISFNEMKEKPANAKSIRVLSYNVNLFNQYNEDADSATSFIKFIARQQADIICLQEYFTMRNKLPEDLVRQLFSSYPYSHVNNTIGNNSREARLGVAIFSRYPIVRKRTIQFSDSTYNTTIYSDLKIGKDTIRVFCSHLESTKLKSHDKPEHLKERLLSKDIDAKGVKRIVRKLKSAYLIRSRQADSIKKVEDETTYPVIFCGDFNDLPASYAYSKIKGTKLDAYSEAGHGLTSTYRGMLPTMRIDYIFSDTSLIPYRYRSPRVKYSDHYPVIVDLYFKRAQD